jgi:hypothetical protein
VGNCLDAGLEVGYVPGMPSQDLLSVSERGKGNVESWLWDGTAVEYRRAKEMEMKASIGTKRTGEVVNKR